MKQKIKDWLLKKHIDCISNVIYNTYYDRWTMTRRQNFTGKVNIYTAWITDKLFELFE